MRYEAEHYAAAYDGVGHVAQLELPRLVARAVVGLLAETGDAGGRSSLAS